MEKNDERHSGREGQGSRSRRSSALQPAPSGVSYFLSVLVDVLSSAASAIVFAASSAVAFVRSRFGGNSADRVIEERRAARQREREERGDYDAPREPARWASAGDAGHAGRRARSEGNGRLRSERAYDDVRFEEPYDVQPVRRTRTARQQQEDFRASGRTRNQSARTHYNAREALDSRYDARAFDEYEEYGTYGYGDNSRRPRAYSDASFEERFSPRVQNRSRVPRGGTASRFGFGRRDNLFAGSSALPWPLAAALPIVGIIVAIVLLVFVVSSIQSCMATNAEPVMRDFTVNYSPAVSQISSIQDPGESVTGFTLVTEGDSWTPSLSDEQTQAIQDAISAVDGSPTIGFCLLDLTSGSGIAYNLDERVYGASSFKAHALIYGCQEALEPGNLSISSVQTNAENAIVWSDNTSYYRMRNSFEDAGAETLGSWLSNLGVDSSLADDTYFPHYSTRESATLWMNAYLYLNSADSDSEITSWAKSLFSETTVSFIRDAVDPTFTSESSDSEADTEDADSESSTEDSSSQSSDTSTESSGDSSSDSAADSSQSASDITVYDKAGWINGSEDDAICDAGIIVCDGREYLFSFMSGASDSDAHREDIVNVISAIWNARSALTPPAQVEVE